MAAYKWTQTQVCSVAYDLATSWSQSIFIQVTRVNTGNGFAIDDTGA